MHDDDHPAHLQHHFDTPLQQFDSAKLGMWLFLATEILLFGGLFVAYAIYRANHPEIFSWAHHLLDTKLGAINTVVLLTSSLTMAWGVRAAQLGQRKDRPLRVYPRTLGENTAVAHPQVVEPADSEILIDNPDCRVAAHGVTTLWMTGADLELVTLRGVGLEFLQRSIEQGHVCRCIHLEAVTKTGQNRFGTAVQ